MRNNADNSMRSKGDRFETVGSGTVEEVAEFIRRDREIWARMVKELNIEAE